MTATQTTAPAKAKKNQAVAEAASEAATVGINVEEPKRNVATKIFVFYKDKDTGENYLKHFDFKSELDKWLGGTKCEVISVIRGVEKKIKTQNKIFFA